MIVDDEDCIVFFLGKLLIYEGYNIFYASNGKQAVELYKANQPSIDLILMDITMPIMNGIEAHKELKQINPKVLIILMSGYSQESLDNSNQVHFIRKPMHPVEICKTIKEVFDSAVAESVSSCHRI